MKIVRRVATNVILIVGSIVAIVSLLSWWYRTHQFKELETFITESNPKFACGDPASNFLCELLEFQKSIEEALVWRVQAQQFHQILKSKRDDADQPLTSEDLQLVHDGVISYLDLRKRIMAFAYKYRETGESHFTLDKMGEGQFVDPATNAGKLFIVRSKLALASAFALYDNYVVGIQPYQNEDFLRRLINSDNPATQRALDKVTLSFQSRANAQLIGRALQFYEQTHKVKMELSPELAFANRYLDELILSSPTYNNLRTNLPSDVAFVARSMDWFAFTLSDKIFDLHQAIMGRISGTFGNAVGLIETRKGLLFGNPEVERSVSRKLKALDILLEKTPFRLTDALIPGYYGHAAVWLGNRAELEELGVWNHDSVQPYHHLIEKGHLVAEALRSGVEANPLGHFLNIDDLAVLRPTRLSMADRKSFIIKAFQQLGKEYDFNFDVETDRRIVCSELVYVVYFKNFRWPTEKVMGRSTISPDHIARAAIEQEGLEPVVLFRTGQPIEKDLVNNLRTLIEGEESILQVVSNLSPLSGFRSPASSQTESK